MEHFFVQIVFSYAQMILVPLIDMQFLFVVVTKFVFVVFVSHDERWDSNTRKSKEFVGGIVMKDSGLDFTAFFLPSAIATN